LPSYLIASGNDSVIHVAYNQNQTEFSRQAVTEIQQRQGIGTAAHREKGRTGLGKEPSAAHLLYESRQEIARHVD
jgi:hypothetical protein